MVKLVALYSIVLMVQVQGLTGLNLGGITLVTPTVAFEEGP